MKKIRAKVIIKGIVQGVGFRPYIHREVEEAGHFGWVRNTSDGAEMEAEGEESGVLRLIDHIQNDPPELAYIESVHYELFDELCGYQGFTIEKSRTLSRRNTLISPDVCICEDCLSELFDPKDRRFRYPFINCTNCGPRFTIIKDVPYDREKTTMAAFPMCPECAAEYGDITSRRYHAQPDCCEACGPGLSFTEAGDTSYTDCIDKAIRALESGKIVAVKGIGGFHLACKTEESVVRLLRERKQRDGRPFALMCRDIEAAGKLAYISEGEKKLLLSRARPIVLLKKKKEAVPESVSSNSRVGIMLPYTPMHYLLFEKGPEALVMTSANLSDLPIIYKNEDALKDLAGIADAFLLHDRDIHTRCDDSVVFERGGKPYFVRRSRGYVPLPVSLHLPAEKSILACGAEQKASFSLYSDGHLFSSQHIGDLKNAETLDFYEEQIRNFENLFDRRPEVLACDLHPDYLSGRYAAARAAAEGLPLVRVQHHFAHMASCMADNGLTEKCIGIVWDGTGLGTDRTIWGAEFLYGDLSGYERLGSIRPIRLPGGDVCTRENFRTAYSLCAEAGLLFDCEHKDVLKKILQADVNCPKASSMGRLFDGVSALLGICSRSTYEGEGAVLLEAAADDWLFRQFSGYNSPGDRIEKEGFADPAESYEIPIRKEDVYRFDWREMIRGILEDFQNGKEKGYIAYRFIYTMAVMAVRMCRILRDLTGTDRAVLSGGTFQNMLLMDLLPKMLEAEGFSVYIHSRTATNDEGISAGQAAAVLGGYKGEIL